MSDGARAVLRITGLSDASASYLLADPAREVAELAPRIPARRWVGEGALALGLDGTVRDADLRAVLEGRAPGGTLAIGSSRRLVAHDLIFAAPKPVSVLFSSRDRQQAREVLAAHQRGVEEALGYVESRALGVQRAMEGERRLLDVDGAIAAAFVHGSSRSGDPHLHSHVLLANLGRDSSGRFGAIDGRSLFAHRRAADAVYRGVLRHELAMRLDLAFDRSASGAAVPREVRRADCVALSGRSEEVRRGARGRPAKVAMSRSEAEELWARRRALAPAIGDEDRFERPQRLLDEHRVASSLVDRPIVARNVVEAICEGATAGIDAGAVGLLLSTSLRPIGRGLHESALERRLALPAQRTIKAIGPRPTDRTELEGWLDHERRLERARVGREPERRR